jgi:hypothetical protein
MKAKNHKKNWLVIIAISWLLACAVLSVLYLVGEEDIGRNIELLCADALQNKPEGTRCILAQYPAEVERCSQQLVYVNEDTREDWYACLYEWGLSSIVETPNK